MQHYGVPTRLLDWTESLAVALYFSVRPFDAPGAEPTIWVLDPFTLAQLSFPSHEVIPIAGEPSVEANADLAFEDWPEEVRSKATKLPIPVAPDFIFRRLAAQNGAFTLHGTSAAPVESAFATAQRGKLLKFVCHPDYRKKLWDTLYYVVPSADALFPDIDGVYDYVV